MSVQLFKHLFVNQGTIPRHKNKVAFEPVLKSPVYYKEQP